MTPEGTVLVLSVGGVPLYSARDLDQTLEPIKAAEPMRRTINESLVDISVDRFKKYASKITCSDVETPAIDGIFPGQTLTVDCVAELVFPTGGSPQRAVVPGSARYVGGYTIYRPRLNMMVVKLEQRLSEYEHEVRWSLELEEV